MNTFCEHHQNSIRFGYRCFDRILLNGLIQPFQQPERVIGFFNAYRQGERVTQNRLRDIAQQFQNWVKNRCQKWKGYSICLAFLKLFERVYSPLTAGLLQPYRADSKLQQRKRTQLDRLYQKIVDDLDELLGALGLKAA
jgi:hypothetical protein